MVYGDTHRFLLRTIASQSVMSLEATNNLIKNKAGNEQINLRDMIQEINTKIKPLKQMIKMVNDEKTSEEFIVFLSLGFDDTSKAQNVFAPVELEFFRLLMEQIMSRDTREITEFNALNLSNNAKANNRILHMIDAQNLLNVWCRMRYLDYDGQNYALGLRAIHEFESYFSKTIADSASMKCYICTSIVFRGYNCPHCPRTIHGRCLEMSLKNSKKWPCCKNVYSDTQLQELRLQSSRANETTSSSWRQTQQVNSTQPLAATQPLEATQLMEATQLLDATQLMETTQPMETRQSFTGPRTAGRNPEYSPDEEMETVERGERPKKRRRINN